MSKKKIAIIGNADPFDRTGIMNAMLCRARHLIGNSELDVRFFLISDYEPWYVRKLRGTRKKEKVKSLAIDGVKIDMLWFTYSIIDYISHIKMGGNAFFKECFLNKQYIHLEDADFVIAHSLEAGYVAMCAKMKYGVPFSVTWHGSDIHTIPWNNQQDRKKVIDIIKSADVNYFVSQALCSLSDRFVLTDNKKVLHNGCDESFIKYAEIEKQRLRKELGVSDKVVLTFAGNLFDVKNALLLPKIFEIVHKEINNSVLWIIGEGKLRQQIEKASKSLPVVFWGYQSPEKMPDFLNCTDVVMLPSKNEGLPLILVEATRCGCKAVGSNVGGIKEIIGENNVVDYPSEQFVEQFAEKVIGSIRCSRGLADVEINDDFSWSHACEVELDDIRKIIK